MGSQNQLARQDLLQDGPGRCWMSVREPLGSFPLVRDSPEVLFHLTQVQGGQGLQRLESAPFGSDFLSSGFPLADLVEQGVVPTQLRDAVGQVFHLGVQLGQFLGESGLFLLSVLGPVEFGQRVRDRVAQDGRIQDTLFHRLEHRGIRRVHRGEQGVVAGPPAIVHVGHALVVLALRVVGPLPGRRQHRPPADPTLNQPREQVRALDAMRRAAEQLAVLHPNVLLPEIREARSGLLPEVVFNDAQVGALDSDLFAVPGGEEDPGVEDMLEGLSDLVPTPAEHRDAMFAARHENPGTTVERPGLR